MASSGIPALDKLLGGEGYPDKSSILVIGPSGIGKEQVLYQFVKSRFSSSDSCLFVTKSRVDEVVNDARANGIEIGKGTIWVAGKGGRVDFDAENLVRNHIIEKRIPLSVKAKTRVKEMKKNEKLHKRAGNSSIQIRRTPTNLSYLSMDDLANMVDKRDRINEAHFPETRTNTNRLGTPLCTQLS